MQVWFRSFYGKNSGKLRKCSAYLKLITTATSKTLWFKLRSANVCKFSIAQGNWPTDKAGWSREFLRKFPSCSVLQEKNSDCVCRQTENLAPGIIEKQSGFQMDKETLYSFVLFCFVLPLSLNLVCLHFSQCQHIMKKDKLFIIHYSKHTVHQQQSWVHAWCDKSYFSIYLFGGLHVMDWSLMPCHFWVATSRDWMNEDVVHVLDKQDPRDIFLVWWTIHELVLWSNTDRNMSLCAGSEYFSRTKNFFETHYIKYQNRVEGMRQDGMYRSPDISQVPASEPEDGYLHHKNPLSSAIPTVHTISFDANDQLKKLTPDCGKPVLDIGDDGGGHMTMTDSNNTWAKINH